MGDTFNFADMEAQNASRSPAGVNFADMEKQAAPAPAAPAPTAQAPATVNFGDLEKQAATPSMDTKMASMAPYLGKYDQAAFGDRGFDFKMDIKHSTLAPVFETLAKPLNAAAGAVTRVADVTGVAPGIQHALNPEGRIFPELAYNDIIDFISDQRIGTPQEVKAKMQAMGMGDSMSEAVKDTYFTARLGLGLYANFVGDPLALTEFGQLTKAAEEARKVADFSNEERNLVSIRKPFSNTSMVEIPAKPVVEFAGRAADKAGQAINKIPGGAAAREAVTGAADKVAQTASDFIQSLSPRTGDPEVDLKASTQWAKARGDAEYTQKQYVDQYNEHRFNDTEEKLISRIVENTPNLKPEVPEGIIRAAQGRAGVAEDELYGHMGKVVPKLMDELKLDPAKMVPGRMDDIVEQAMQVKRLGKETLESRVRAGKLTEENAAQYIMENHLVHKANPAYVRFKDMKPEVASARVEADLKREASRAATGSLLSRFDQGKFQRKIEGSLEEANAAMKERTGVDNFFITNPMAGTAMRFLEAKKLERDKELLDFLQNRGRMADDPVAKAQGWKPINHPEFKGSKFSIVDEAGKTISKGKLEDMVFPKHIADKMSYFMSPKVQGNFAAFFNSYNRTFRGYALASPGYYLRNWAENMAKNFVQGVKLEDYVDASKILRDKPLSVMINGKPMDGAKIHDMMTQLGIFTGGQFREGIGDALAFGKKYAYDLKAAIKNPIKIGTEVMPRLVQDTFQGLRHFGEKGENFTRASMFLSKLKDGYQPEMAAFEVEKYLFDFTRNSKTTDQIRTFMYPFIQHALKTAFIAPEMVGAGPRMYNFMQTQFLRTIGNSFNDPMTQQEVLQLLPDYRQWSDPVAGPLMPGNSWLAKIFTNPQNQGAMGSVMYFKASIGLDILNRLNIFSDQMTKEGFGLNPLLRSFITVASGRDAFFGKNIDINPEHPNFAHRLNYGIQSALESEYSMPNTMKFIKQSMGIGDPRYFEPATVLALRGSFSQFGGIDSLDRDFFFRTMSFMQARKDLMTKLVSLSAQEAQGKTVDALLGGHSNLRKASTWIRPMTSADVFAELKGETDQFQKSKVAASALMGGMTREQVASAIKGMDQQTKELNENYQVLKTRYFQMLKEAKDSQGK